MQLFILLKSNSTPIRQYLHTLAGAGRAAGAGLTPPVVGLTNWIEYPSLFAIEMQTANLQKPEYRTARSTRARIIS